MGNSAKPQAVRGMHDLLPDSVPAWRHVEERLKTILEQYACQEVRLPLVERTEVFARSIGMETDIVCKEMYSFADHNGEQLSLRPEGTAGALRAMQEHGLLHNRTQRVWYIGPMFRHERPQKGRYRQFHQLGVELYGHAGPDVDAELLLLGTHILRDLEVRGLRLEINSLGSLQARTRYRETLVEYCEGFRDELDEENLRRLQHNPLRILDSKDPDMSQRIAEAPSILDHLDQESEEHFQALCHMLDELQIEYHVNPRLVRGLDYYEKTVFEWLDPAQGNQGTVCAGGRYDRLPGLLGGRDTPAIGFAMGLERLIDLLPERERQAAGMPDIYVIHSGEGSTVEAFRVSDMLRQRFPALRILQHSGGGNFKKQFKKADQSGAALALVLGPEERETDTVGIKFLRERREQQRVSTERLSALIAEEFSG